MVWIYGFFLVMETVTIILLTKHESPEIKFSNYYKYKIHEIKKIKYFSSWLKNPFYVNVFYSILQTLIPKELR